MAQAHICDFLRGRYWHTYNFLEDKLVAASKYITIDSRNSLSWSEELANLLVMNGNAVDIFFRNMLYCPNIQNNTYYMNYQDIQQDKRNWNIRHFREIIEPIHHLSNNTLVLPFGIGESQEITPYDNFSNYSPNWWESYNHVKHDYYDNIEEANLSNVLNSLGALLTLNALHQCSKSYLIDKGEILSEYQMPKSVMHESLDSNIGLSNGYSHYNFNIITKVFIYTYRS
jgi:hypothetical protein